MTKTPFLDIASFTVQEVDSAQQPTSSTPVSGSPFLSIYELEEYGGSTDPNAEEYVAFLSELYDEEFDEAVFELVNEAAGLHDEWSAESSATLAEQNLASDRSLEQHFEPLAAEIERTLEALAERFGSVEPASISESEIDSFLDEYRQGADVSPSFENFFGAIKNTFKKVAKKAVGLAKKGIAFAGKFALGPVLKKLKALIKPLLRRVLRFAIGKLPKPLQPVARKLAKRLPLLKEVEGESPDSEDESTREISHIQHEFDQQLADLLFATSEVQQDLEVSRALAESREPFVNSLAEFDDARERFISELGQLKEEQDPTPLLENFLPALMPVLKLGLKLIGRPKVVNFLAKFLAKLIKRFVGPKYAPPLARAIVDAGMKLVSLEMSPQDEERAAGAAVSATVEDTVRRVAGMPEYVLDNQELLEASALEAFEQAAVANLPQVLSEEMYMRRPNLRETKFVRGAWLMHPFRGRRRHRYGYVYKKFCPILHATISPQKARAVESFDGVSLAEFLEEQLGLAPGSDIEADVHIYESLPGTTLPEIVRLETNTVGLGTDTEAAYGQIHPLTTEAAATLLGEPDLGREDNSREAPDRMTIEPGQRFYYLEIPGAKPKAKAENRGRGKIRRPGAVKVILDFPSRQIRVCIYLSEVKAQRIALKLRQQAHIGAILTLLRAILNRGLLKSLRRGGRGRLKIIHETVSPEQAIGGALRRIPLLVLDRVRSRLQEWLLKGLVELLKERTQQFLTAAEDPKDGVTLVATIADPPGLDALRQALKGRLPSLSALKVSGGSPAVKFDIVAGHSNA